MNYNELKYNITFIITAACFTFITTSCGIKINGKNTTAINHNAFTSLLKKHVDGNGLVNYKAFIADKETLQIYLTTLSNNPPTKKTNTNEKLAYWINAYNAFTIKLILDNYPVNSIKDLGPENQIIFINTPWDKKFFTIGGRQMTLNNIEHRIIRNQFKEPRIHFALNCASISCPILRNEAYEGPILDKQLDEQAILFINDTTRNKLEVTNTTLSSIFKWYGGDFRKWSKLTVKEFVNKYANIKITKNTTIDYLKYNWNLNDIKL